MDDKDVIELLRHYRHDLMNHLQIVQGYLSMGKTDKVQVKLKAYMEELQEEGKLIHLNVPAFALSILQFNFLHTNFRLTYHIHTENEKLASVDQLLAERCQNVMKEIKKAADEMALYELDVHLYDADSDTLELEVAVSGKLADERSFMQTMENMGHDVTVHYQDEKIKCTVSIPCKRGG
ncbi:Spo0B domain-containing protein [Lentibacillus salicampi]|uniref:SpoOB alpha-helical domain-containing protein n=1 Tax=Lentibacillus salicampi TaxID=175306 RepID=A0A4Y9ADW3_9BACI|nr:Spo0B domain-containing protein [Lentibacillus salicampi]TFJ93996.1 hypothetical protein E4U82_04065 [Lentibacillus salicampi]